MRCPDLLPVLQKRECSISSLSTLSQVAENEEFWKQSFDDEPRATSPNRTPKYSPRCKVGYHDRIEATPKRWTPKYSPLFKAGPAQALGPPHLLPPPPGVAPPPSATAVSSAATPSTCRSIGPRDKNVFCFSDPSCTPSASPATRTPSGISPGSIVQGGTTRSGCTPPSTRRSATSSAAGGRADRPRTTRIDPDHIPWPGQPRPIEVDGGKIYETDLYHIPPPATEVCTVLDRGSTSCEFMRCTMNSVPASPGLANTSHVPLAVLCQPFAELTPQEELVPCIDLGETGPFRCAHCKAYANPYFKWENSGSEARCNLCDHCTVVPEEYLCSTNEKGERVDRFERAELKHGTVDYVAPRDYSEGRLPGSPVVVFALDVSRQSVQSGFCAQVVSTLRQLIGFLQAPASRVALLTFDDTLHFHTFRPRYGDAQTVVVTDIEDPFVPCGHEALCVDVELPAHRAQFDALLQGLLNSFTGDVSSDLAAGGSALKAAVELAGLCGGGHVIMFHGTLQNHGLGALEKRDDISLYGQPEMGGLFKPQEAALFDAIAAECDAQGVSVSAFCAPPSGAYMDIASMSRVPRHTGGDVCYIPRFDPQRDGEQLHYTISRTIVQSAAHSCIFKLRCSKGLEVDEMYAPWDTDEADHSSFHLPRLSVDASVLFSLQVVDKIEGRKHVFIQAACLHTDRCGRRLIRVQTLRLPVTSSLLDIFRYTDINALTTTLLRQSASAALNGNVGFKERLTQVTAGILHAYRVKCAKRASTSQLILPESLKLLPLYVGSIRKIPAFRPASGIRVDERIASLLHMLRMSTAQAQLTVYPTIYQLAPLPSDKAGLDSGVGDNVHLPPRVRCSVDKLNPEHVYLIDDGLKLHIYVRPKVSHELLERVFDRSCIAELPAAVASWASPEAAGLRDEGCRALAICQQLRRERCRLPWLPLCVVGPGTPEEALLLAKLPEDPISKELSYPEFLVHLHGIVRANMEE